MNAHGRGENAVWTAVSNSCLEVEHSWLFCDGWALARSLLLGEMSGDARCGASRGDNLEMERIAMKCITLALLVVATACTATPSTPPRASASGIGSPRADFAKYQTFTFGPANPPASGYEITARSLEVQRKLAELVQASLQGRGYQQSPENADLVIKVSTGSGTLPPEEVQRGPVPEANAGFIGIDAYDRASGAGVWHGSAFAEIDPQHIDEHLLRRGVEDMLASFPARGK